MLKKTLMEVKLTPEVKEIVERIRKDLETHKCAPPYAMAALLYTFNLIYSETNGMNQKFDGRYISKTYGELIEDIFDLADCSGQSIIVDLDVSISNFVTVKAPKKT